MDDHKINVLLDAIEGLFLIQMALCNILIKNDLIKREEIGLILDTYIKQLEDQNKKGSIPFIKGLRQRINEVSPIQFPTWLRDLIDEQDKNGH